MLKIKLARFGKRGQPHFRFVINEARDKRDGAYVEAIGHYAPTQEPKLLKIDVERYTYWTGKGAQPTPTVATLFARFQSGNPFPQKPAKLSAKAKAKQAALKEADAAIAQAKQAADAAAAAEPEVAVTQETPVADETPATE